MKIRSLLAYAAAALPGAIFVAFAVTFVFAGSDTALPSSVFGSSGNSSSSTNYELGSTSGQSSPIGVSSSSGGELCAGFWCGATLLSCPDADGDTICDADDPDDDNDGCADSEELPGAPAPKPGSTGPYDPLAWYDFYDVPVSANPNPTPNGDRNQAVTMGDVLAVLLYVGTFDGDGGSYNPNGVAYDSLKGSCDVDGDTVADKEGLCYDRSPSAEPNPPWEAGPPSGAVNMQDVLAVLAQVGLACTGPP